LYGLLSRKTPAVVVRDDIAHHNRGR